MKFVCDCFDEYVLFYIFFFVNMWNIKFKEFKEKFKVSFRCCIFVLFFVVFFVYVLLVKCGFSGLNFFLLILCCSFDESM